MSETFLFAMVVFFLHACTWPGMIGHKIFNGVRSPFSKLPTYLKKPLFDCPTCMAVWWTPFLIAIYILGGGKNILNSEQMIIVTFATAGVNAVISKLIKRPCNCDKPNRTSQD